MVVLGGQSSYSNAAAHAVCELVCYSTATNLIVSSVFAIQQYSCCRSCSSTFYPHSSGKFRFICYSTQLTAILDIICLCIHGKLNENKMDCFVIFCSCYFSLCCRFCWGKCMVSRLSSVAACTRRHIRTSDTAHFIESDISTSILQHFIAFSFR